MNLSLIDDIRRGYTKVDDFFIKHSTISDERDLEDLTSKFLSLAVKRKVPTEKQAEENARLTGLWTDDNERELITLEGYLKRAQESFEKVIGPQKKDLEQDLNETIIRINNIKNKKYNAIGRTAEMWAADFANERYILGLIYRDGSLKERKWTEDESEDLDRDQVNKILIKYSKFRNLFTEEAIKDAASSGLCQNLYSSAGNAYNLFGKEIINLTCLQQRLSILISYYRSIIEQISGKVSDSVLSDWREMEKWAKSSEDGREQLERGSKGGGNQDNVSYSNIMKVASASEEAKYKMTKEMLK